MSPGYPPSTSVIHRDEIQTLDRFIAQQRTVLRKLAVSIPHRCVLQLLDCMGRVAWSSGGERGPNSSFVEIPLDLLSARLRLHGCGADGRLGGEDWLRVVAVLLDSAAAGDHEMTGLIDEHIALTDQLLTMYNIVRGTRAKWDLNEQLGVVLQEAIRSCGMDAGFLWISGPPSERLILRPDEPELRDLVEKWVHRDRRDPQLGTMAVYEDSGGRFHACTRASFQAGSGPKGAIGLLTRKPDHPILARDTKLASAMADLAGTYAETASLQQTVVENLQIAKEMEIARSIQDLLVPRVLGQTHDHEVAAYCEPARNVAGDFYLVREMTDDRLILAFGDVTGKGVAAALLMSMVRTAVMSLLGEDSAPAAILERISRTLYEDLDRTGKLVTLLLALYDRDTGSLTLANAGHSPVYLSRRGMRFRRLSPTATPLGVTRALGAHDQSFSFHDGDLLVVTSDGFSEARNSDGELFGLDRQRAILDSARTATLQGLIRRLVDATADFAAGTPQADDQTALALRGGLSR
jgi:sigma-B regulation protein RsbU (phosphoserine phosphatase)